jgi:pre-mRNA branch site protein p14
MSDCYHIFVSDPTLIQIVYEDVFDAKNACEHLSGFNLGGRYLIVLYFNPLKMNQKNLSQKQAEVDELRKQAAE